MVNGAVPLGVTPGVPVALLHWSEKAVDLSLGNGTIIPNPRGQEGFLETPPVNVNAPKNLHNHAQSTSLK